jgi:hypothetical protein
MGNSPAAPAEPKAFMADQVPVSAVVQGSYMGRELPAAGDRNLGRMSGIDRADGSPFRETSEEDLQRRTFMIGFTKLDGDVIKDTYSGGKRTP